MSEYISRQSIGKAVHDIGKEIGCEPLAAAALARVMSAVSCIPDADVTPVVHGYWEPPHFDYHWYKAHCSVCGHADERSGGDKHTMENYKMPKICENCGAIMDLKPYNEWIPMSYGRFKWNGEASENER